MAEFTGRPNNDLDDINGSSFNNSLLNGEKDLGQSSSLYVDEPIDVSRLDRVTCNKITEKVLIWLKENKRPEYMSDMKLLSRPPAYMISGMLLGTLAGRAIAMRIPAVQKKGGRLLPWFIGFGLGGNPAAAALGSATMIPTVKEFLERQTPAAAYGRYVFRSLEAEKSGLTISAGSNEFRSPASNEQSKYPVSTRAVPTAQQQQQPFGRSTTTWDEIRRNAQQQRKDDMQTFDSQENKYRDSELY